MLAFNPSINHPVTLASKAPRTVATGFARSVILLQLVSVAGLRNFLVRGGPVRSVFYGFMDTPFYGHAAGSQAIRVTSYSHSYKVDAGIMRQGVL